MPQLKLPRLSLLLPVILALLCGHAIARASFRVAASISASAPGVPDAREPRRSSGEESPARRPGGADEPRSKEDTSLPDDAARLCAGALASNGWSGLAALPGCEGHGGGQIRAPASAGADRGHEPARARSYPLEEEVRPPSWQLEPPFAPRAPPTESA